MINRIVVITLGLIAATVAHANGSRLPSQDAFAVARGYAFTATADNPSAIYYNPAGIAQLRKSEVLAGTHILIADSDYRGAAGSASLKDETFVLPYFYAVQPIGERWTVGASAHLPYGLSTEWPNDGPFRTIATRNEIEFIRYSLAAAFRPIETVMVGASLQFNDVEVTLNRGLGMVPGDNFGFKGNGDAWSFNAGLLWEITPQHVVGVTYQSKVVVGISGPTTITPFNLIEPASVDWPFPENVAIGYSFRPTPKWNIEFGYDWTNWSRLGVLSVSRPVSGPLPLPFNWNDSAYWGLGATRYVGPFHISAGVNYSEESVSDASWNPAVVDYDRWLWNLGAGLRGEKFNLDIAFQWSPKVTRTIQGSAPSLAAQTADGTYTGRLVAIMLQGAIKF